MLDAVAAATETTIRNEASEKRHQKRFRFGGGVGSPDAGGRGGAQG